MAALFTRLFRAMLVMVARVSLLTLALACTPLCAHDLWIEPTTFVPEPGQTIGARLRVGQDFVGDVVLRDPALIKEFVAVDSQGSSAVVGRAGDDPAGIARVTKPGLLVIGYHSHPSAVELAADKFNEYLKEEGLDAIVAQRASRKESGAKVREQFSRCAKSLVLSGAPSDAQGDRILGFTLELLAERNPYSLRDGEALPLRLTYENRPLAGALVVAMNRRNPAQKQMARTDRDGRVRFQLRTGGMWLIKAVHMVRAPLVSRAEWSSYWASLTFERRGVN
jgi:uncharacterized GH25 family protein